MAGLPCIEAFPRWLAALFFLRAGLPGRLAFCVWDYLSQRATEVSRNQSARSTKRIAKGRRRRGATRYLALTLISAMSRLNITDRQGGRGGEGHNLRYEIINRTVYVYSICTYVCIYRTPARSGSVAQPWLKKRPTNLVYVCICVCIYRLCFFFSLHDSCDDCNLGLYPAYISEDPR